MANCLQVAFTYINANNEQVEVTLTSEPLPSNIEITPENELDIVRQVLLDIYNNPNKDGYRELQGVLNSSYPINYTTNIITRNPLLLQATNDVTSWTSENGKLLVTSPSIVISNILEKIDSTNDLELKSTLNLQKAIIEQLNGETIPYKIILHEELLDIDNRRISDDGTEGSYFDREDRNIFLFHSTDLLSTPTEKDNTIALLNALLHKNGINKSIKEISDLEDDFDISQLGLNFSNIRMLLNTITSSKTTVDTVQSESQPQKILEQKQDLYGESIERLANKLYQQGITSLEQAAAIYYAGNNKRPGKIRKQDFIHYTDYNETDLQSYSQFLSDDAPPIDKINLWEGINKDKAKENDYIESSQVLIDYLIENGYRGNETPQHVRKKLLIDALIDEDNYYQIPPLASPAIDSRTFFLDQQEIHEKWQRMRKQYYSGKGGKEAGNITANDYVDAQRIYRNAVQFFGTAWVREPFQLSNGKYSIYIYSSKLLDLTEQDERKLLDESYIERDWDRLSDMEKAIQDLDRYNGETSLGSRSNFYKQDPQIRNKYFNKSNRTTVRSLLKKIANSDSNLAGLANSLIDKVSNNVDIYLEPVQFFERGTDNLNVDAAGYYTTYRNEIRIAEFANFVKGRSEALLLHEIIHALTFHNLRNNSEINSDFFRMFSHAKENIGEELYALTNLDEFIVGLFTDSILISKLKTVPPIESVKIYPNLFSQVFDYILSLFNINKNSTEPTFYEQAWSVASNIIDSANLKSNINNDNFLVNESNFSILDIAANDYKSSNSSYKSSNSLASQVLQYNSDNTTFNGYTKSDSVGRQRLKVFTNKLAQKYGLNVDVLSSKEISDIYDIKGGSFTFSRHRAFIDGDNRIVINGDKASFAEPIHELSHLVLDGLKITRNDLYTYLTNNIINHPTYEKIRKIYPELNEQQLREEVFVTVLGEQYNGSILSQENQDWSNRNDHLFTTAIKGEKQFFSDLFGIDNFRFFDLTGQQLMNMSMNDIMDNFTTTLMDGGFMREIEISNEKQDHLLNDTYLKNNQNTDSSFYTGLRQIGFGEDIASTLWIKSRSNNFYKWHQGDIITNSDEEPRLFFRGKEPFKIYDTDIEGKGDVVVVKGNLINEDVGYRTLASNIKSVNTLDSIPTTFLTFDIDDFANNNSIRMIGSEVELKYSISKLKEQFPDYEYNINSFGNTNFIEYQKKPNSFISDLRTQLLNNNIITKIC